MLPILRGVVKVVALAAGLPVALFGLMALVGALTDNGWVRLVASAVVLVGAPMFLADRLLPRDDPTAARGLPTDVLAVSWLALALVFVGLGGGPMRGLLLDEAERNWDAGWRTVARAEMRIAGARPDERGPGEADRDPATKAKRGAAQAKKGAPPAKAKRSAADAGTARASDGGTPDAGARPERTPAELFREFAPAVVTIVTTGGGPFGGEGEGGGTGFVIDGQVTIVTNHHVIEGARKIKVKLFDGTTVDDVEILDESEEDDLALLRIPTRPSQKRVVLGDSDAATVGERVISIGNPLGLEHTLTDGLVSARRRIRGRRLIQMSAPVSPGNSGGPLFNLRGEVIGVTVAQFGGGYGQNLNLAVPINLLKPMIRDQYPDRHRAGEGGSSAGRW